MREIISVFILASAILAAQFLLPCDAQAEDGMTYSRLRELLKSGQGNKIQKVVVTNGTDSIDVQLVGSGLQSVVVPTETKGELIDNLDDAGVRLEVHDKVQTEFWFSTLASFFLPILLLVGFFFMFRSAAKRQ